VTGSALQIEKRNTRGRLTAMMPGLFVVVLSLFAVTMVQAASPLSGGLGVATGGYVTTLFLEPISYQSSGYYYDQNNSLQYCSYTYHHGVDVSGGCVAGVYPVYAAAAGTVAFAQYVNDGYGTQIAIDHGHNVGGNGRYTYTFYAHMGNRTTGAQYINVSPGQNVQAGQVIGYQGNDGSVYGSCSPSPGTHLDWEIRVSDSPLLYNTTMRYSSVAASQNYYTGRSLTYNDPNPLGQVSPGPFSPGGNATPTPVGTPTPGPCGMTFSDLPGSHFAYQHVGYLYCRNVISGYADGTFRPDNPTTRGQFAKMIAIGMGWTLYNPYFPTFSDVAPGSTFYQFIESAYLRGLITGYPCGGPNEPCDTQRRPYFRWGSDVTWAQATKMVVTAKGWAQVFPATATFSDVPRSHWAFGYVEAAYQRGIISRPSNGRFGPETIISRAWQSRMLALAMQQ